MSIDDGKEEPFGHNVDIISSMLRLEVEDRLRNKHDPAEFMTLFTTGVACALLKKYGDPAFVKTLIPLLAEQAIHVIDTIDKKIMEVLKDAAEGQRGAEPIQAGVDQAEDDAG